MIFPKTPSDLRRACALYICSEYDHTPIRFPKTPSELRARCALSVCSDYDESELARILALDPAEALRSVPIRDAMRIVAGLLPHRQLVTWSRAAADRAQGYANAINTKGAHPDVNSRACAAAALADSGARAVARTVASDDTRIDAASDAMGAMRAASAAATLVHASEDETKLSIELGLELLDNCQPTSRSNEPRDAGELPAGSGYNDLSLAGLLAMGPIKALKSIPPRDATYFIAGLLPRKQLVTWAKEAGERAVAYGGHCYYGWHCALAAKGCAKNASYATRGRDAAREAFRAINYAADAAIYDLDGAGELKRVLRENELRISVEHGIKLLLEG